MLVLGVAIGAILAAAALMLTRETSDSVSHRVAGSSSSAKDDEIAELESDSESEPDLAAWLAVLSERERIYRDLHDDIGGKLLTLVHTADGTPQADLAREVLQDLRAVIASSHNAGGQLAEIMEGIREEAEMRLETAGCALTWMQDVQGSDLPLAEAKGLHLQRIIREAITNALRHSPGKELRIRVHQTENDLLIDVTDDAPQTMRREQIGQGRGTNNMRERAQALHGHIHWDAGSIGGTKVLLRVPLTELFND